MQIAIFFWVLFIIAVALDIYRMGSTFFADRAIIYMLIALLGIGAFGGPIK